MANVISIQRMQTRLYRELGMAVSSSLQNSTARSTLRISIESNLVQY